MPLRVSPEVGKGRTGGPGEAAVCRLPPAAPRVMLPRWPHRTVHPGLRCKPGLASPIGCFELVSLPFQPLSCVEPRAAFPEASAPQVPRWGKPLPEEAAPAGSGGALEPPVGRRRRRPCSAGSRQPRGGRARSRSAARLRVVGSPSAPAPGRGRSTALI